ncbi:hypothetical protein ACU19_00735 [Actinobaculum suis]|nr:hypothetical protein ACU19_00735 [Actinobaculum suis]
MALGAAAGAVPATLGAAAGVAPALPGAAGGVVPAAAPDATSVAGVGTFADGVCLIRFPLPVP